MLVILTELYYNILFVLICKTFSFSFLHIELLQNSCFYDTYLVSVGTLQLLESQVHSLSYFV